MTSLASKSKVSPLHKDAQEKTAAFFKEFTQIMDDYCAKLQSLSDNKQHAALQESHIQKVAMQTYMQTFRQHFKHQKSIINDRNFIETKARKTAFEYVSRKKQKQDGCCSAWCIIS